MQESANLLICAVSADDNCLREPLGELFAAGTVLLDDLDMHPQLQKLTHQIIADLAAADDQRTADVTLGIAHFLVELAKLGVGGCDIDLVACHQPERAVRDGQLLTAQNCADQHVQSELRRDRRKPYPVQNAALRHTDLCKLHASLGKGLDVDGIRIAQHPRDLIGCLELGVDHHGDTQLLTHKDELLGVAGIAHTRHRMSGAELACHQTAHDVGLVGIGHRDDDVRCLDTRFLQVTNDECAAAHALNVVVIDQTFDNIRVVVHDSDVVPLIGQGLGQDAAGFAAANDQNIHVSLLCVGITDFSILHYRPIYRICQVQHWRDA